MIGGILRWIAAGCIVTVFLFLTVYLGEMKRAYHRVNAQGTVVNSMYGAIEFTDRGNGPPVLVIHGSGGGYDQGELIASAVLSERFRLIIPSRFGYLRSTFREGANFDDQAHAFACLLDTLGIEHAAIVALSHGGPSALLFAVLYPERVSSLTLISAGVASSTEEDQKEASKKGDMLTTVFRYNPLYWSISKLFRSRLINLMGANEEIVASLTPNQRELIDQVIDYMNPVAIRSAGVAFDNKAAMPNERIAEVKAPTLILHAVDDMLQIYHNAEFAYSTIEGSKLVRFERGGHFLMIVEQESISELTQKHIIDNSY